VTARNYLARHRWCLAASPMFFLSGKALGGCQPRPHHRTPWGVAPRRLPVSSLGSPVRGSRLLAPVARNCAQRVRGRRRWVNPFALANEQTIVSIPSNQGVGRPGHGSPGDRKDPAGKENGCGSHRRGAGNRTTSATHAGRQAGREISIGITHEVVRSCRPTTK